jgi:hypothetical protein
MFMSIVPNIKIIHTVDSMPNKEVTYFQLLNFMACLARHPGLSCILRWRGVLWNPPQDSGGRKDCTDDEN